MGQLLHIKPTQLQKLITQENIIESICSWNALRYKQEYNHSLTDALLKEEYQELIDAIDSQNPVSILDALGDIFFVAVGALWKQGKSPQQISTFLDKLENANKNPPFLDVAMNWYFLEDKDFTLGFIILATIDKLTNLLKNEDAALDVVRVICISNNTKEVKKTDSSIKANINKGAQYVSPTKALETLLKGVLDNEVN